MAFRPITCVGELPAEGNAYETSTFDMKVIVKKLEMEPNQFRYDSFELAKDIAAFANSIGGIIVVGAAEYKTTGNLIKYLPIPEQNAREIRDEFSKAAIKRCIPVPLIEPVIIEKENGFVVVINIWPFPAQAVGVKVRGDKNDGHGDVAYVFPLRSGVDTSWIRPEQLPMLMLPEIRRINLLLESIPIDERSNILVHAAMGPYPQSAVPGQVAGSIVKFELLSNSIEIDLRSGRDGSRQNFNFPLDAVKSVWKDASGKWCIALGGLFGDQRKYWIYA